MRCIACVAVATWAFAYGLSFHGLDIRHLMLPWGSTRPSPSVQVINGHARSAPGGCRNSYFNVGNSPRYEFASRPAGFRYWLFYLPLLILTGPCGPASTRIGAYDSTRRSWSLRESRKGAKQITLLAIIGGAGHDQIPIAKTAPINQDRID